MTSSFFNRLNKIGGYLTGWRYCSFYLGLGFWSLALIAWCAGSWSSTLLFAALAVLSFLLYGSHQVRLTMFGKNKAEAEVPQHPLAAVAPVPEKILPVEENLNSTVIASGVHFEGNITAASNVYIHGEVIGNVEAKDGLVKVMHNGSIKGNINCTELIIDGTVTGECKSETINIYEHGNVNGALVYISLSIKKGGVFIGKAEMLAKTAKKPPLKVHLVEKNEPAAQVTNDKAEKKDDLSTAVKAKARS